MARPLPVELAPSCLCLLKGRLGVHRPLVISDFVPLLASLRVWSSKIIGDIGVDDDMTQHVLLEGYGTSTNLKITFLHRTPQVCESATQEGSTFGFHIQASCPLWGTYAHKYRFRRKGLPSEVECESNGGPKVLPNHLQNVVRSFLQGKIIHSFVYVLYNGQFKQGAISFMIRSF